jgi:hypothetical protein
MSLESGARECIEKDCSAWTDNKCALILWLPTQPQKLRAPCPDKNLDPTAPKFNPTSAKFP